MSRGRLSFDGFGVQSSKERHKTNTSSLAGEATVLISDSIWTCFCESFGQDTCAQAVNNKTGKSNHEIEVRPVNITADSRALCIERIKAGFDRLVDTGENLYGLNAIHNTAALLDLYRRLWLEKFKNNSDYLIPHERKCLLVNWASAIDTKFDPEHEFTTGIETIKAAEKRHIALAELSRPFFLSPTHSKTVSTALCRLFLFGYWSSALHLLDRCYSYEDDAFNDFNAIIYSYYPQGSYDFEDPENPRHPFNNIELLVQFRQDIRTNLMHHIQFSDDHLLKDLLIILSDPSPQDDDDDDHAIGSSPGELKLQELIFSPEHDQSLISTFTLNLFWFPERCEALCCDLDLNDQNSIGLIFQKWWHELKFDVEELPSTVIAYALTLGEHVDKLHEHLFWATQEFVPMFAFAMFWFVFYDFPVDTSLVVNNFFPALLDLCDILPSENSREYDQLLSRIANPYTMFLKTYRSATCPFIPETLAKTILNKPITSLASLKIAKTASKALCSDREIHRQFYFECLKVFMLSGRHATPIAKLYAILELNDIASETLIRWTEAAPPGELNPPRYAVKAAALADAWLKSISNTSTESEIINFIQSNRELRERIWAYLDAPMKPLKTIELAALADHIADEGDWSVLVFRIYCLLQELVVRNIRSDRIWDLLATAVGKNNQSSTHIYTSDAPENTNRRISARLWQEIAKNYPTLLKGSMSPKDRYKRLNIFRAMTLCTTEDNDAGEYPYKISPLTTSTTLRS